MTCTDSASSADTRPNDEVRWSTWMVEAQQGDQESYRKLLTSLANAITAYLRVKFGNIDFLEDCVQECLLAIHQGRHTYQCSKPFRPWMFAVVRHKAIDMLRHRARRPQGESMDDDSNHLENSRVVPDQSEELMVREEFFIGLPNHFREALVLTRVIGLSVREAADHTGVTEAAMKVRVHRALKALRKLLDEVDAF